MKYFIFTWGMRGCYMPDTCETYAFETRAALKSFLLATVNRNNDDGAYRGLGIRTIARAAAHAWKGKRGSDTILPYGFRGQGKPYAYELSPIDRREYLSRLKEEGNN